MFLADSSSMISIFLNGSAVDQFIGIVSLEKTITDTVLSSDITLDLYRAES